VGKGKANVRAKAKLIDFSVLKAVSNILAAAKPPVTELSSVLCPLSSVRGAFLKIILDRVP
jgi:hypothetical protein